jgi:hypothetical protein
MPQLVARFAGLAERSGRLAYGHANIVRAITQDDDQTREILTMVFDVPDLPPERVVDLIAILLERHESLRTTYRLGSVVTQHVAGSGELAVEIVETDGDPFEEAVRTARRLRPRAFDMEAGLPLRAAVVTRDGTARHVILVIGHVAMDVASSEILLYEWTTLTAGGTLPPPGPNPLDVIEFEQKPSMQRLTAAAVSYWETQLHHLPQAMFPVPASVTATKKDYWHPGLRIRSSAAIDHLTTIAARTGASHSIIMLAAVNALVGHHTGHSTCVTTSVAGNRVARQLRDLFGTISQDALLSIPVSETGTFDELVHEARSIALAAYRASWFDPTAIWVAINGISSQRGISYARDFVFNDMSSVTAGSGGPVVTRSAQGRLPGVWIPGESPLTINDPELAASLEPRPAENIPCRFVAYVYRLDTELDTIFHVDPLFLDADQLAEFGRSVLRLLAAAADHDVPIKDLATLTTLPPMARGDGWYLTDSCWIEIGAVRDLLAEILGDRPHLVVAVPDEDLGHRVVCYLTDPADPEHIHQRCMALLWARVTAIAPHEYVVCAAEPPDPTDPAGWAALPVLARADGRAEGSVIR